MTPIFYGQVQNGKLKLEKREKFEKYLSTLRGQVTLTVEKWTLNRDRSLNQNRYYWGVVVKMIADEMAVLSPDDAHDFLKRLFLKRGIDFKGKRYEVVGSTASLDTQAFEDYLTKCRMWAAQELNMTIPLPNEIVDNY